MVAYKMTLQAKIMIPLVQNNLKSIQRILHKHNVKRAFVFGSVCTENFNDNSDIDIIVAFQKRYFDNYVDNFLSLESELSKLLEREVDIVPEETIQNPYFIQAINQTKIPIYESGSAKVAL
jgi:predicted nucleotidyltransferase